VKGTPMSFVYGPIASRRLGQSLGIDPVPLKTCNWNCVYCQLGRTQPLLHERKEYVSAAAIVAELRAVLLAHPPGTIDWVTFAGSGEPTLHSRIGWLIRQAQALTDLPVAMITNGALLYVPEVREELSAADAVLPTLCAGTAALYRRIHRPHPECTFERLLDGLIAFRAMYGGKLWPEVMLIRGLNDTEEALRAIAAALRQIRPDAVHINLPIRPPAEAWVRPPDDEGLMRALAILGEIAEVVHPAEGTVDLRGYDNVADALLGVITRHPLRQEEIERALAAWAPEWVRQVLAELEASGQAQAVERYGVRFWSAAPAHYPDSAQSRVTAPEHRRHKHLA
jgi:wyosine [tRNA(Phe)-imidazoG37] synthetase (radical SAM superfamily)